MDKIINKNSSIGDMENMIFATTVAVLGHAEAIVTEIGMNTQVGKIAKMIITDEAPQTPIQKKLEEVGKILGIKLVDHIIICKEKYYSFLENNDICF